MFCSFAGSTGNVQCFSGAGVVSTEAEVTRKRRQNTLSSHVVFFLYRVSNQAQLFLEATSGAKNFWSKSLKMIMMSSNEDTLGLVPCGIFISLNCSEYFPVDPAIAPINATGHQLVTLSRLICAEKKEQIFDQRENWWGVKILLCIS